MPSVLDGLIKEADLKPDVQLQPHQKRVLKRLQSHPGNLLLMHALGSGKSLTGIASAEQTGLPYTAVVPASLRTNMRKELDKFVDPAGQAKADVMSYTGLAQGKPVKNDNVLFFDEAHRLRNPGSLQTQRAMDLAAHAKQVELLTGTPIVNDPSDLAVPMSILTKKQITPKDFTERYVGKQKVSPGFWGWLRGVPSANEPVLKHPDELKALLSGHVDYYAPERATVPTTREDVPVEMSTDQARLYRAMWGQLPWLLRWKLQHDYPLSNDDLRRATSFLVGPRQVGLSTYTFQGEHRDALKAFQTSTKLQEAHKRLTGKLKDPRTKALVFSNFIDAGLTPYAAGLAANNIPHAMFHGGLSDLERKKLVDDFNTGRIRVALLGPSGSEGLSFKGTQLVQLLDPYWNSVRGRQSEGRALRYDSHWDLPEDLKNVTVQRYISKLPLGLMARAKERFGFDQEANRRAADDYLENMAARKDKLNKQFIDVLKEVGSKRAAHSWLPEDYELQMAKEGPHRTFTLLHKNKAVGGLRATPGKDMHAVEEAYLDPEHRTPELGNALTKHIHADHKDENIMLPDGSVIPVSVLMDAYRTGGFEALPPIPEKRAADEMEQQAKNWVKHVMETSFATYPPPGVFTRSPAEIADAGDQPGVAPKGLTSWQRMVLFHRNRGGRGLADERRQALQEAIQLLSQRRVERQQKPELFDQETLLPIKQGAERPYRDRAEMFALKDNKVLGGIYDNDRTFGVFGGGIESDELPEEAAAREFAEESGYKVLNPREVPVPPLTVDWNPPYTTPEQASRAKQFRGSRTRFFAGQLSDEPKAVPSDPSGLQHIGLRRLSTALRRLKERPDMDEVARQRTAARAAVISHLLSTIEKQGVDENWHTDIGPEGQPRTLDVNKLWEMVNRRKSRTVPINQINMQGVNRSKSTGFSQKRYETADTSYPVIIDYTGRLLDGRHRLYKLLDQAAEEVPVHKLRRGDAEKATVIKEGIAHEPPGSPGTRTAADYDSVLPLSPDDSGDHEDDWSAEQGGTGTLSLAPCNASLEKVALTAKGIPDRSSYGDPQKELTPGDLVDYIVQRHEARRAGEHYDIRLGTPETGLFSWASRKGVPEPGQKRLAIQQPLHSHSYGKFEGTIHKGYGAGKVYKHDVGQALVTRVGPDGSIHFTLAHTRFPERFMLLPPKAPGQKNWLMLNTTKTQPIPYQKVRYATVPPEKAEEVLGKLSPGSSVQQKIDGAASLTQLFKDHIEVLSYRKRKDTGGPIVHTERVFQGRPEASIPKHLVGTVLRGELYGVKDKGRTIEPQEVGGILNSGVARALRTQRSEGIRMRNALFDVDRVGPGSGATAVRDLPYEQRMAKVKEIMGLLPRQDVFHTPEEAKTPEDAIKMWRRIALGQDPITEEGIVIHPPTGKPAKVKLRGEHDVYVREFFPGMGKYKDNAIGGFRYSHEPEGPIVGEVGTGLSDALRRDMFQDPDLYKGRIARVLSPRKLPSGALFAPALLGLHEDYSANQPLPPPAPKLGGL